MKRDDIIKIEFFIGVSIIYWVWIKFTDRNPIIILTMAIMFCYIFNKIFIEQENKKIRRNK